jgi:flavin reductase (DIM6/NTAB) family NADH-FMN oxidoreductase RutF
MMPAAGDRVDPLALRRCLGHFASGVTVVSFDLDGSPWGFTASSFTSVSLEPPLVLVSVARVARSHDLLPDRPFTVNVLRAAQEHVARRFASVDETVRQRTRWVAGPSGPRLPDALAYLACAPWRRLETGDHTLYLGRVVAFDGDGGDALGFYRSRFVAVAEPLPSQPPTSLDPGDPFELPYDAF